MYSEMLFPETFHPASDTRSFPQVSHDIFADVWSLLGVATTRTHLRLHVLNKHVILYVRKFACAATRDIVAIKRNGRRSITHL